MEFAVRSRHLDWRSNDGSFASHHEALLMGVYLVPLGCRRAYKRSSRSLALKRADAG
jgi:hypothetical protein